MALKPEVVIGCHLSSSGGYEAMAKKQRRALGQTPLPFLRAILEEERQSQLILQTLKLFIVRLSRQVFRES